MDAQDRIVYAQTGRGTRIGTAQDTIGAVRGGMPLFLWLESQARSMSFLFRKSVRNEAVAEINHGRWIVRCACCAGAEEVDHQTPFFFCLSCGNADNNSHVMTVVFPKDREAIEKVLLLRPDLSNRNWTAKETAEALVLENIEHGYGVAGNPDFNSQLRGA